MAPLPSYAVCSASDVFARIGAVYPDPKRVVRERPDLGYVECVYLSPGAVVFPALGFHAVSSRAPRRLASMQKGFCYVREEGMRSRAPLCPPCDATFVHNMGRIIDYSWLRPHTVRGLWISDRDVRDAVDEVALGNPDRFEIVGSMLRRDEVIESMIGALASQAELDPHAGQLLACDAIKQALACHLALRYGSSRRRRTLRLKPLDVVGLRRAEEYLRCEPSPRLATLALRARASRFQVAYQFRLATGQTPAQCLNQLRVERAKVILARGERDALEVSRTLGFRSFRAFSTVFRSVTGITPQRFTLLHR